MVVVVVVAVVVVVVVVVVVEYLDGRYLGVAAKVTATAKYPKSEATESASVLGGLWRRPVGDVELSSR